MALHLEAEQPLQKRLGQEVPRIRSVTDVKGGPVLAKLLLRHRVCRKLV